MLWLFDTTGFVTRVHCGAWPPALSLAYQAANLLIALSYFAIPVTILSLWKHRRSDLRKPWILVLFAAFIVACGLTHLADFAVFYWAGYRLYTVLLVVTATLSVATAIMLVPVAAYAIRLPSREQVHRINNELNARVIEIEVLRREEAAKRAHLEEKVLDQQAAIARMVRSKEREEALSATRDLLRDIRARPEPL